MPLMNWSDRLSVGVAEIDREHQELVRMLNDLAEAMNAGRGRDALAPILDELISYTKSHFGREEEAMRVHAYPEAAEHMKQHADLARQVLDVQAKLASGAAATLPFEVLAFLKGWLLQHIQKSDKALGAFLVARGASKAV